MDDHDGLMERYGEAMEAGDLEAALGHLDEALKLNPDSIPALGCRGNLLGELDAHEAALRCFDRVVEIAPEMGAAHYTRGLHLTALGRIGEALQAYTRATELSPDDPDPLINRGRLLDDTGDPEAAVADYDQALALNHDEEIAWANRGNSLNALERFDEALTSFDEALKLEPDSPAAALGRAHALMSLGRIDEANAARPLGTELDPGEVVELTQKLEQGGVLVLRYYPGRHSHPELLDEVGRGILEHCAQLEGKDPGLSDGVHIGYGWSLLTVRERGDQRVLCEPDFSRHPLTETRHDVTFTLQALVMMQVMHSLTEVPPSPCHCTETMIVEHGALERETLVLHRVADSEDGFSGWVAGPNNLEEVKALHQSEAFDAVPTAEIARRRAHLIKVITLPPGFVATFEGHAVVSVLDDEGEERFAKHE